MKKIESASKAKATSDNLPITNAVGEEVLKAKTTCVARLNDIVNSIYSSPPEPDCDYGIDDIGDGMSEIEGQLKVLQAELFVLEQVLRPHMPDHLYEVKDDERVANEGYFPATSKCTTPAVLALCEIANTIQCLRRYLNFITTNIVV